MPVIEKVEASTDMSLRDIRQRNTLPGDQLARVQAVVIGVGAVGHQVVLCLASMGVGKIHLWDPDIVSAENLAPQGFNESSIGEDKVRVARQEGYARNKSIFIDTVTARFTRDRFERYFREANTPEAPLVVFSCVDSLEARAQIWEIVKPKAGFLVDVRMLGPVFRVLTVDNPSQEIYYETKLFPQTEAFTGGCTRQSLHYCALMGASYAISSMSKWLRGLPNTPDYMMNLDDMSITTEFEEGE